MDRDQTRQREHYQGDRSEEESSHRQGDQRTMTYPSQDRQSQGGQGAMQRSGSGSSAMTTSGEPGGEWQGFVVPYRYYGPGYAGLGYYAVYYQGGAGQRDEADASQEFDQRNVRYGQGQGAGAAWQPSRSQGGQGQKYGGESQGQGGQWQTQGDQWSGQSGRGYAGRGPKGYRRSDDRIREEISDQFMDNDQLDASEIEVEVVAGVVTLTGTVEDRQSKRLAEDIAERGSGVRDVMNQLKVDNGSTRRSTGEKDGASAGAGSSSSGSRTSSRTRSSSGTRSATGSRARGTTTSRGSSRTTSQSQSGSTSRQPVGAATGGPTDGATGNGANGDQSSRESGGQSR